MLKQPLTILLCGLLFQTVLAADAWALQPQGPASNRASARVRDAVERLGSGSDSLVAVRLRDKSVVSGRISGVQPDSFSVVNTESGVESSVAYADVSRLAGMNLLTGQSVQYGGGVRAKLSKALGVIVPGMRPVQSHLFGGTLLLIGIIIGILIAVVVATKL